MPRFGEFRLINIRQKNIILNYYDYFFIIHKRSGFRPLILCYLIAICLCDDVVELLNIPVVGNPTSPHRTSELNTKPNMARSDVQQLSSNTTPFFLAKTNSYGGK